MKMLPWNQLMRPFCSNITSFSDIKEPYLDPAAAFVPSLLKTTWFAFVVKRVNMPSGTPSGNVWTWIVLLDTAVTNFPF